MSDHEHCATVAAALTERIIELEKKIKELEMPCQCCRDHGCSDGCRCKQLGDDL